MKSQKKSKFRKTEIGMIPEDWEELTLRESGVKLFDCDHKTPPAVKEGYPYITIPQLINGRIDLTNARRISHENYIIWTRKTKPQEYDIILSRRCNPGETAIVIQNLECALGQNLVILRSDGRVIFPPFLKWLLRSPSWWEQVKTFINVGAIFDSLKCADIPNFSLPIPPMNEQKVITDILSSLDDKIELLQSQNKTLEAIGQTIFKHWFIDFEFPNEKGKTYKSSGGKMVDSELGKIPKGWGVGNIGDLVTVKGGTTPDTENSLYWSNGTICWCTPKDLSNLSTPILLDTERKITKDGLEKISSGLLPKHTVLLSSRAPIGYLAINEVETAINQGFIAVVCDKQPILYYMFFWIKNNIEIIKSMANGSTFQEINKANFRKIDIIRPSDNTLRKFDHIISNIHGKLTENSKHIVLLTQTRDSLLPKLMAGKIRVPV